MNYLRLVEEQKFPFCCTDTFNHTSFSVSKVGIISQPLQENCLYYSCKLGHYLKPTPGISASQLCTKAFKKKVSHGSSAVNANVFFLPRLVGVLVCRQVTLMSSRAAEAMVPYCADTEPRPDACSRATS